MSLFVSSLAATVSDQLVFRLFGINCCREEACGISVRGVCVRVCVKTLGDWSYCASAELL